MHETGCKVMKMRIVLPILLCPLPYVMYSY